MFLGGIKLLNSRSDVILPHKKFVVATFTPRRSDISGARFTRSPLLASRLPAGCLQAAAVHYGTRTASILNVHRFVIKSSLFTGKWIG